MPGRNRRTHYSFLLGEAVEALDHTQLLRFAQLHMEFCLAAIGDADRHKAAARADAALEVIREARRRGEQLRMAL